MNDEATTDDLVLLVLYDCGSLRGELTDEVQVRLTSDPPFQSVAEQNPTDSWRTTR
ncbi:hypothetical protein [Deinococcus soli (ex Cha et al. 2016)]|uniref:Uncharacterized protein n=2 Tax=Deinococcus soli (ex Cha et al. 2016) TaxID=1309411 RepID=A0ACC6KM50_9DEIO|nr:hypothetical protein [Deinococcus soli (ex Cha et al. 2016)]MDR6220941.1 hypothetical protein [Deinococcus soli (ex Cha et al. 2016)]MDR6330934.1 hypothetical protein [Deinococcus soli (ex Cha et al. 2016)]MDR6753663.1 hypothetical protein [Deinococcus soli (ex Cha et al. 2016)]